MKPPAAVLLVALALLQQGQQRPVFRSGTDLVTVEVSVRSGNAPVAGLRAADFTLTDNGVAQTIAMLDVEALPIDLTLVIDTSGSMTAMLGAMAGYANEIHGMLRADDRLRLLTVAEDVRQLYPFHAPRGDPPLGAVAAGGSTSIYDGIATALMHVRQGDRRHLVLAMTDGEDTNSALPIDRLKDVSQRTDSVLDVLFLKDPDPGWSMLKQHYQNSALDTRRPWMAPQPGRPDYWQVRDVAGNTGGDLDIVFGKDGGVPALVRNVLEKFRASYVLRYKPSAAGSDGWHAIEVKVPKYHGLDIRARKGYFVGK
jgi:VWFA-related protein